MHADHLCGTHRHYRKGQFPRGNANPKFKHGRYSQCLPEQLRQRAEAAATDPQLLSQREEIALLTVRIQELLQADDRDEGEVWEEIRETMLNRDRLVRSEVQREVQLQNFIPADEAVTMMGRLAYSLRQNLEANIPDEVARRRVISGFAAELRKYQEWST